ncbi:MAG: M20/M25/M40 family metallo-hydrolase [Eubacteriales bacterium]|nr:M20/M25/M40 family metallo-hydrolase [Eubacteriales bacterium]
MALNKKVLEYIDLHREEALQLLLTLAKIPAPSNHEEKRAAFCKAWLEAQGAEGVYIDDAFNVIYPVGVSGPDTALTVFSAHSDVVFPDTEELPLFTENGRIYCPGVGDDTANAVALMTVAKYVAQFKLVPQTGGVLFVITAGEEGLGNAKGARRIMAEFGRRVTAFFSLDGTGDEITNGAIGSKRFRIRMATEGGHSYWDFGNRNAIACLASLIDNLYAIKVDAGTTYNVGTIEGGTSVNTIAQSAEMLYEFRAERNESLAGMEAHLNAAIELYRAKGVKVEAELIGERPCAVGVDPGKERELATQTEKAVREHYGLSPVFRPSSTDCNIPLSLGIPAVSVGCCLGKGAHTRGEYVELSSLLPGLRLAFDLISRYIALL